MRGVREERERRKEGKECNFSRSIRSIDCALMTVVIVIIIIVNDKISLVDLDHPIRTAQHSTCSGLFSESRGLFRVIGRPGLDA